MAGFNTVDDEVSVADATALISAGTGWLLDVREQYEWDTGHAPGAHHIPMQEVGLRSDELPEDEQIFVICHTGARSAMVTNALRRAGFEAANVVGGMDAWQRAGEEVVRG
jgi:rhodanese-related sulfurtransferase